MLGWLAATTVRSTRRRFSEGENDNIDIMNDCVSFADLSRALFQVRHEAANLKKKQNDLEHAEEHPYFFLSKKKSILFLLAQSHCVGTKYSLPFFFAGKCGKAHPFFKRLESLLAEGRSSFFMS